MSITRCLIVQVSSVAVTVTLAAGTMFAQSRHVLVPADRSSGDRRHRRCHRGRKSPCSRAIQRKRDR
jgi:hypothetical protein